ncbi:hypothetical protein FRB95_004986, partial [Tulasnella sp. JGI-2019a]
VAQRAPQDPLSRPVPSSYTTTIDAIRLDESSLNVSESVKKPRASLIRTFDTSTRQGSISVGLFSSTIYPITPHSWSLTTSVVDPR